MITVGSDSTGIQNSVCVSDGGDVSQRTRIISKCEPALVGRYVHVKNVMRVTNIVICEIEIYGNKGNE